MGGGKEGFDEELTEEGSSSDISEEDTAAAELEAKAKHWEALLLRMGVGAGGSVLEGRHLPPAQRSTAAWGAEQGSGREQGQEGLGGWGAGEGRLEAEES